MGRKRTPGLCRRRGIWHIDKYISGYGPFRESCKTRDLAEAERYLTKRLEDIRQAHVYGVRPKWTWRQAATKYLEESNKRSLGRDAQDLRSLDVWIGDLPLESVHMGTMEPYIAARREAGIKSATVNRTLSVVRRILNLAARLWRDEHGLTWLTTPPMIVMQDWDDARQPYPLDWGEQARLFKELPPHLARMALFKVNTGCRENEVVSLRWDWEIPIPELGTSVFIIPRNVSLAGRGGSGKVKNGEDRLVVLNSVAGSIVESCRGNHPERVFTFRGSPIRSMYNTAWKRARRAAELPRVRVHDLKHTYGRRLRAAGVSLETRKVLLGHKSGDITTHYSAPELEELIAASERVCNRKAGPRLIVLKTPTARQGVRKNSVHEKVCDTGKLLSD